MLTLKQGLKISAIIDKLDIKIVNPNGTQEQVGADMMMQLVSKAHRAEQEIYAFVADIKKVDLAEAESIDLVAFIKEIITNSGMVDFFKSAVKLKDQD